MNAYSYDLDLYAQSHNVPAGTHLIEVAALGYFFSPVIFLLSYYMFKHDETMSLLALYQYTCTYSQVRVDISARNPGNIHAVLTENHKVLYELILEPLREEHYYEACIFKLLVIMNTSFTKCY